MEDLQNPAQNIPQDVTQTPTPSAQATPAERENKLTLIYAIVGLVVILGLGVGAVMGLFGGQSNPNKVAEVNNLPRENEPVKEPPKKENQNQYNWSTMNQGPYRDKVSFATSEDLLNWTDSEKILAEHASVPDAIYKDGTIYAYFVDVATDGIAEQLGLIKSSDNGQSWSEKQIVKIEGVGERVPVDPDPFVLPDGQIRLYYFDINAGRGGKNPSGINTIYSAISTDGVNFTQEDGARFEYSDIYDPDVIKVGDSWKMYVGTGQNRILSAISSDGLNFTYEGIAAEGAGVPNTYYDGSKYLLFTAGIEIWSSLDGEKFTKTSSSFSLKGITADPGVIKLGENSYLMMYKTKDPNTANPKN